MDYRKLYDALITIRDACDELQKETGCDKCPMRTSTGCGVYHSHPFRWDVNPWVWVIEFERCDKPEGWCSND